MNSASKWRPTTLVRQAQGFSLVELLVVMAIVATLAGLLLPALAGARKRSYSARCLSNLHQIGIANTLYSSDFADSLAFSGRVYPLMSLVDIWLLLSPYLATNGNFYICPADRGPCNVLFVKTFGAQYQITAKNIPVKSSYWRPSGTYFTEPGSRDSYPSTRRVTEVRYPSQKLTDYCAAAANQNGFREFFAQGFNGQAHGRSRCNVLWVDGHSGMLKWSQWRHDPRVTWERGPESNGLEFAETP